MTIFCLNDSISNIVTITLVNNLDLSHCDAQIVWTSVFLKILFPGVGSLDKFGVFVITIVSLKEEEL